MVGAAKHGCPKTVRLGTLYKKKISFDLDFFHKGRGGGSKAIQKFWGTYFKSAQQCPKSAPKVPKFWEGRVKPVLEEVLIKVAFFGSPRKIKQILFHKIYWKALQKIFRFVLF